MVFTHLPSSLSLIVIPFVPDLGVVIALLLVDAMRGDEMLRELGEPLLAAARRLTLGPAPEHLVLERALRLPGAEDLLHLADDQLEHLDLALEDLEHVGLERAATRQIDDAHGMLLPQSMHATDALLDPLGIPGQVIVHDERAELEVEPFGAGLGGDQQRPALPEVLDERGAHVGGAAGGL